MYVIPTYKNIMIGEENSEEGQIVDYDQIVALSSEQSPQTPAYASKQ